MAEVTFRIPSKAVQYGYVERLVLLPDDASPELVASTYVNYVYAFQKEEQAAIKRLQGGVSAPQGADPGQQVLDAVKALDEGLGGVTEVGSVIEETVKKAKAIEAKAPWSNKVDAKPKPWETENLPPEAVVTAPAVLDAAW